MGTLMEPTVDEIRSLYEDVKAYLPSKGNDRLERQRALLKTLNITPEFIERAGAGHIRNMNMGKLRKAIYERMQRKLISWALSKKRISVGQTITFTRGTFTIKKITSHTITLLDSDGRKNAFARIGNGFWEMILDQAAQ